MAWFELAAVPQNVPWGCFDRGLDRRDAYTLLSLAGDFGLTQVGDGEKGVHVLIRKDLFAPGDAA